jgi:hypothetical protein
MSAAPVTPVKTITFLQALLGSHRKWMVRVWKEGEQEARLEKGE